MTRINDRLNSQRRIPFISTRTARAGVLTTALLTIVGCQSAGAPTANSGPYSGPNTGSAQAPNASEGTNKPKYTIAKYSEDGTSIDWDTRLRPLFEEARVLVSEYTNVDLSDVTLNLASDTTITDEVGFETQRLIHNQFDNKNFANKFLASVMNNQEGTYAALYATRKAEVMISMPLMRSYKESLPRNAKIQEAAILALLIHELVHAADDKRFDIHKNRDLNFRASFAQSAAFEGHAQYATRRICENSTCLAGLEALDIFMFGAPNSPNFATQATQEVSRNILEYSYVEGERFVTELAKRSNGKQLIAELLSNPPQDPIQILNPQSFPDVGREQRNQELIQLSTAFNHPWLQSPWKSVQTSPLKGVNLRTDPSRREAAVHGFTKLITSMVALQLYDQSKSGLIPIELTVLRTDTNATAKQFAVNLHQNAQSSGAALERPKTFEKVVNQQTMQPALMYLTKDRAADNQTYYTLIGVSGTNVVQIAGLADNENLFVEYIDQVLLRLSGINPEAY